MGKFEVWIFLLVGFFSVESLTINLSSETEESTSKSDVQTIIPNDPRCKSDGMFGNPVDCTSYYVCKDGTGQDRKCPVDFKFDSVQHCTLDDAADCGRSSSPSSTLNGERVEFKCPEDYGYFIFPEDCRKYVTCTGGVPTITECPEQQFYQNYVGCIESRVCPQTQTDSMQQSGVREECYLPPDVGTCDAAIPRYYYDTNIGRCRNFIYGGCEGNNNNFRTLTECELACLTVATQNLQGRSTLCQTSNHRYPDPSNCRRYTQCHDFHPKFEYCPIGKGYNKRQNRCVDIAMSDCRSNSVVDIMESD